MKPLLRKIFLWDAPAQGAFFGLTPFSCCSCLAEDFEKAVLEFLGFHERYAELAARLAKVVTEFTTPVGSGTVARTQRIPIGQRARAAVIAWMRHNTTDYDHRYIPRIAGKRREVRRDIAQESLALLKDYRRGNDVSDDCPLRRALVAKEESEQTI